MLSQTPTRQLKSQSAKTVTIAIASYASRGVMIRRNNKQQRSVPEIIGSGNSFQLSNWQTFLIFRHELWSRLADVCTGNLSEATVAGVDFDGIVRCQMSGIACVRTVLIYGAVGRPTSQS
ncbi:hypothetical protein ACHAXS_001286 [Conticribra weissflogii]